MNLRIFTVTSMLDQTPDLICRPAAGIFLHFSTIPCLGDILSLIIILKIHCTLKKIQFEDNCLTMSCWFPLYNNVNEPSIQFTSVTQSCPTLCDPMDCSTPGLPVHHQLPEFTQTHVHPAISSSVIPFSSCLQSFPASGSFPMSQFFASGGQSIGVSALVLPMNIWD